MKTRSWILIIALLLAVCLGLSVPLLKPGQSASRAQIWSQGRLLKTVPLDTDQQFTVTAPGGGSNTVTVRDGRIAVTEATCPDHYCMHRGWCSGGAQIVCLPNGLVIAFPDETEIDGVIG